MILHDKGIYYESADLWMDSSRIKQCCYVSHAHADHTARHKKIISTPETAAMACQRLGRLDTETVKYNQWIERENYRFKLFPAGHVLGSSQILIDNGDIRLVYTGDFRLGKSRTCESAVIEKCDVLLIESTYGSPQYKFDKREEVEAEFLEFIQDAIDEGRKPVVLAYALGKAQEAMAILSSAGIPVAVHDSVLKIARIYERFNVNLGRYSKFRGGYFEGVLIIPPHMRKYKSIKAIPDAVTVMLTGWGVDENSNFHNGVDKTFIISDHCDYDSLIEYVKEVEPKKIFTLHGFESFANDLIEKGFNAQPMRNAKEYRINLEPEIDGNLDLFD